MTSVIQKTKTKKHSTNSKAVVFKESELQMGLNPHTWTCAEVKVQMTNTVHIIITSICYE
jgi:hypothetical protein